MDLGKSLIDSAIGVRKVNLHVQPKVQYELWIRQFHDQTIDESRFSEYISKIDESVSHYDLKWIVGGDNCDVYVGVNFGQFQIGVLQVPNVDILSGNRGIRWSPNNV